MKRWLPALALLLCLGSTASARQKLQGYCQNQTTGARVASCTITVYLTGTTTLASIYADNFSTVKSNPFVAASSGLYQFYADNGGVDIQFSGGAPTISPAYTLSGFLLLDLYTPGQPTVTSNDFLPQFDNILNLGSASQRWANGYFANLTLAGNFTVGGNVLPGTNGNDLGSSTARWDLFVNNITWYAGTSNPASFTHTNTATRTYTFPDFNGEVALWTSGTVGRASFQHANTVARAYTFPDLSGTVPLLGLAQTWSAAQTFPDATIGIGKLVAGSNGQCAITTGGVAQWGSCNALTIKVNGGATVAPLNFGNLPGATTNNLLASWQYSAGNISVQVPISGNGSAAASTTGALTSGHCAQWDASGNVIDSGAPCATGQIIQSAKKTTGLCTTGSSTYDSCSVTVSWPNATLFSAGLTYVPVCVGKGPSNPRANTTISSYSQSGVTVNIVTYGSVAVTFAELDCIGVQ